MVSLMQRRREMMKMASSPTPVVEPNVTITEFTGNGTNSVAVDLGMSNPTIMLVYAKVTLSSSTFWNNDNGYRLMQLADADYAKDLYVNTTNNSGHGGRLGPASTALLKYENGVLSFDSSAVLRDTADYRILAINPNGSPVKQLAIQTFTGNGQNNIEVDLGDINPSILLLYPTAPMNSGSFPNNNNGQRLFEFKDTAVSESRIIYANTRNNTATGNYMYGSATTPFTYENRILTITSGTVVLRSSYTYKIIAIE